jgi:hypothetical protein
MKVIEQLLASAGISPMQVLMKQVAERVLVL